MFIPIRHRRPIRGWLGSAAASARASISTVTRRPDSPARRGEKDIDNNFYKTVGCWKTYRGAPRLSSGALQFNDSMRNGAWTTVIVVAGKGDDPLNDKDVTVGFYVSGDKMVKDGNGNIARDYTFSIKPDATYEAIFPARSKNGVITSTQGRRWRAARAGVLARSRRCYEPK